MIYKEKNRKLVIHCLWQLVWTWSGNGRHHRWLQHSEMYEFVATLAFSPTLVDKWVCQICIYFVVWNLYANPNEKTEWGKWRGRKVWRREKEWGRGRRRESGEDESSPINSRVSEATVEKRGEQALEGSECFRTLQLFKEARQNPGAKWKHIFEMQEAIDELWPLTGSIRVHFQELICIVLLFSPFNLENKSCSKLPTVFLPNSHVKNWVAGVSFCSHS